MEINMGTMTPDAAVAYTAIFPVAVGLVWLVVVSVSSTMDRDRIPRAQLFTALSLIGIGIIMWITSIWMQVGR